MFYGSSMGIPAYFSYILRAHGNVLQTATPDRVDRLYMDCNSILYDVFHRMAKAPVGAESMAKAPIESPIQAQPSIEIRYKTLIDQVILAIESYVKLIRPHHLVYVAFDGVAPRAKMNQQRQRRYKSEFMKTLQDPDTGSESIDPWWTTTMFTPGTRFMTMLTAQLKRVFGGRDRYIISASDEPGEGEHKMTQHVRDNLDTTHIIAWYGLDSDLIMLAMLHARPFHRFYLFREKPEFASALAPNTAPKSGPKSAPGPKTPPEIMYMNIHRLAESVYMEVAQVETCTLCDNTWRRVYDYVFLCFFLGNDFLPHFPALNLRTHGIQVLTDTYRKYIMSHKDAYLVDIDTNTILWKQVQIMIQALATMEHELILKEYVIRDRQERRHVPIASNRAIDTIEQRQAVFEQLPMLLRGKEKYIAPHQAGWESRYYRALFPHTSLDCDTSLERDASTNYLEALEWVFTYYVDGCKDWQWQYRYAYPPLLCDLVRHVPHVYTTLIHENTSVPSVPSTSIEQLQYVLPPSQHHLIPSMSESKTTTVSIAITDFEWAFCKYFWEAHLNIEAYTSFPASPPKGIGTKGLRPPFRDPLWSHV